MKVRVDDMELGTKVYSYSLRLEGDSYQLVQKVGVVEEQIVRVFDGMYTDKIVRLSGGDPIYSLHIDEVLNGRVVTLSDDRDHALGILLKYDEDQLKKHRQLLDRCEKRVAVLREILGE